jgi:hypothetical protein
MRDDNGDRRERDNRGARGADRFGRGDREERADREECDHARGLRGRDKARTTCRNIFSWPFRRHDDDMDEDDDYDHPGLGGILLTVYFGTPSMFITLWFGFDYGTNPPLGTLIT